jgi:hypothetical protein
MNSSNVLTGIKSFILLQIDKMSKVDPLISVLSPLITRVVNKNYTKISTFLDLIADSEGNIDVENILTEMIEKLLDTKPFTVNTSFIGDIEIGGGEIKFSLPFTHKSLVLDITDIETFKHTLTTNS